MPAASPEPAPSSESAAFAAVYTAHRVTVAGMLCHVFPVLDRETVDELTQGVFLEIWAGDAKRRAELLASHPTRQRSYLCLVARSRAVDLLRRQQIIGETCSLDAVTDDDTRALRDTLDDHDPWAQPETAALERDTLRAGLTYLDRLTPRHRTILRLILADWGDAEIAAHLGMSTSAVSTTLSRLRARLRAHHLPKEPTL